MSTLAIFGLKVVTSGKVMSLFGLLCWREGRNMRVFLWLSCVCIESYNPKVKGKNMCESVEICYLYEVGKITDIGFTKHKCIGNDNSMFLWFKINF